MGRLTYRQKDSSWGLKGLSWEQPVALPSRGYGALDLAERQEGSGE